MPWLRRMPPSRAVSTPSRKRGYRSPRSGTLRRRNDPVLVVSWCRYRLAPRAGRFSVPEVSLPHFLFLTTAATILRFWSILILHLSVRLFWHPRLSSNQEILASLRDGRRKYRR